VVAWKIYFCFFPFCDLMVDMFKHALHENYNTVNFEGVKINIRSLWSVVIMPCHCLHLRFYSVSTGFIYSSFFPCVGRWNSVLLIHLLAFAQVNSFLSSQLRMLLLDFISTINTLFSFCLLGKLGFLYFLTWYGYKRSCPSIRVWFVCGNIFVFSILLPFKFKLQNNFGYHVFYC
jgi:hypothetical protein